ncbi:MAG: sigma-70 family RNA polymerase sigma factor [Actinomycetota bacterium]|nr:sigma-70 family RNA polymerase sigma factor [Actinomycetota bacterium]
MNDPGTSPATTRRRQEESLRRADGPGHHNHPGRGGPIGVPGPGPAGLEGRRPAEMAMNSERRTSDSALVVAVARRDQAALAELHRRHGGSLFCGALRVLSVRTLAEEVVQEIFLRLWERPERFDPSRGTLRSFLLAECHGRAIDIVRAEKARRHREERAMNAEGAAYVNEDDILDFVVGQRLREAVANLCCPEREAISLAYFGGHTYAQVALILGVPEGTIKSRIRSGLTRLRTAVVEAGIDPRAANIAPSSVQS